MLLTQLSIRAKQTDVFEAIFPTLQLIHRRLSVSPHVESTMAGATQRNLAKAMSKMSCQQMIYFAQKNPNLDAELVHCLKDQLSGSRRTATSDRGTSFWL